MIMATKMTKRDHFSILREYYPTTAPNYDEIIAFIDHEVELLEKKSSSEKKPSKTQEANEILKESILNEMEDNRVYTITEMLKTLPCCEGLSNQKVSAIIRLMVENDKTIIKEVEKRTSYFKKA
jgi:hypothetical protein